MAPGPVVNRGAVPWPLATRDPRRPRIFQIGFNRCGTKSLYAYFKANGLRAIHWKKGKLAYGMELARREGVPLLSYTGDYDVYTDMERVDLPVELARPTRPLLLRRLEAHLGEAEREGPLYAFEYFRELDEQYPESRFILNLRKREDWARSRRRFRDGGYLDCPCGHRRHDDEQELFECWYRHWDRHIAAVKEYFEGRPEQLLVFDIDRHGVDEVNEFFSDLELDASLWPWENRTREAVAAG